jgi:hypothetical protein
MSLFSQVSQVFTDLTDVADFSDLAKSNAMLTFYRCITPSGVNEVSDYSLLLLFNPNFQELYEEEFGQAGHTHLYFNTGCLKIYL